MRLTRVPLAASLTILLALHAFRLHRRNRSTICDTRRFSSEQGRFREAVPLLDQVIAAITATSRRRSSGATATSGLTSPTRAMPDFEQAIHYNPLHPGGYTDRGIALLMLGRNEEALASFKRRFVSGTARRP